jgi:hypothetical protein
MAGSKKKGQVLDLFSLQKKKRKAERMCNAFGEAVQWWSLTVAIVLR